MAKKKKSPAEDTESTVSVAAPMETSAPGTDKPKGKRGRPKGSKTAAKAPKKTKGKRGRPKGSKNKSAKAVTTGKRPRGRPPGSGKKAALTPVGLRGIITQIVRDEVHAALLQAFKGL